MPIPGRELVDPWISRLTYIYVDPIIILANKVSHLNFDQLPALLDVDYASYLTKQAFQVCIYLIHFFSLLIAACVSTSTRSLALNDVICSGGSYTTSVRPQSYPSLRILLTTRKFYRMGVFYMRDLSHRFRNMHICRSNRHKYDFEVRTVFKLET